MSSYIWIFNYLKQIHWLYSSEDPHQDIKVLLARYESNPESEAQLKLLLPQIVSCFLPNKSVSETIEELKKHQSSDDPTGMLFYLIFIDLTKTIEFCVHQVQLFKAVVTCLLACLVVVICICQFPSAVVEWANEALQGLGKGAPFSLSLTQKHFSRVASALGKNDNELSTVSMHLY